MSFKINLYNNNILKQTIPSEKVIIPKDIPYIKNKEYILTGYASDKFHVNQVHEIKKMTFSVKNIIYKDYKNDFCMVSGIINSYQDGNEIPLDSNPVIKGYFYNLYVDSVYECEGFWESNKDGRLIFRVMAYSQVKNSSIAVIQEYLLNVFKGLNVGPVTINKITNVFGLLSIEKIKNDDVEFSKIIKNEGKRIAMVHRLQDLEDREQALGYLISYGLPISSVISIIDSLGVATYSIIKKNPNILFKFPFISNKAIDRISINEGLEYNHPDRIAGLIQRYISHKETTNGDIFVEYDKLISYSRENDDFLKYVASTGFFKEPLNYLDVKNSLDNLILNNKVILAPDILDSSKMYVYRQYFHFVENQIVDIVKNLEDKACHSFINSNIIKKYIEEFELNHFKIDTKQKNAIYMALQNSISILSGGPGTGKTQTIKMIVDIFMQEYPDKLVQLCAPTGKASRRMSEVINLPASTIHKSLNYVPFSDVEINDIKADLLIIDESSMVDIDLFYKVLSHISENTSILLVGDYNQLPSVGPGLILRDLIDSNVISYTILTSVFRQSEDSNIVDTAYNVLNNHPENIKRVSSRMKCHDDFIFLVTENYNDILNKIKKYIIQMINNGISPDDIQVLTPFNNGNLGVSGLNIMIREIINPNGRNLGEIYISPTRNFGVGDRVIQTKNNYELEVFNGSIGRIISIDESKGTAVIEFDGVEKDYKHKDILDLKLGYAVTVHKSQGSEFNYVLMPMHIEHLFVSNRNLLYTAITRARKKFILIGSDDAFIKTCEKIEHFSRKSQIKNKLINN